MVKDRDGDDDDDEQVIPQGKYIKKRALKNKSLAVPFNDKDLKDYVTGFHKRKKKRRKEAMINLEEKARLKRIDNRKKRKLDRLFVQFGGAQPASGSELDENGEGPELEEETEPIGPPSVDGMQTYDNGGMTITVKTSEISREEDDESLKEKKEFVPKSGETEKKRSIPVKKKPLKATGGKGGKRRSTPKPQKKRDKRMGKLKSKKR